MHSRSDAPEVPFDEDQLVQALEFANLPALLAVTYQLTGDRTWVSQRYAPTRARGMDENRNGGLDEERQREVRAGAASALLGWSRGADMAVPALFGEELIDLLCFVNGEEVSTEYETMMSELLGFTSAAAAQSIDLHGREFSVLVVGAGISGMLAAMRLSESGVKHTVIEKNEEVGGGWFENTYPGAGVDTPSYLYSYSMFQHDWQTYFGKRDDVEDYLQRFADHYALRENIQFNSEVECLSFDEDASQWTARVRRSDGSVDEVHANAVISSVGVLNRPKIPDLPGLNDFSGVLFHSSRWPSELDVSGKRVAVVGAGASAMQIAPAIAAQTDSLTIFQRSPQWIAPNSDYFEPVDSAVHWLIRHVPLYAAWYRAKLNWIFNDRIHPTLKMDPEWSGDNGTINVVNDGHRRFYTRYIIEKLGDRQDLIDKSLPDYPPFGKRMLLDNGWYEMLTRPNVDLVTEGVVSFDTSGLIDAAGTHHEFDIIVMATGFEGTRFLHPMQVVGRGGTSLADVWDDGDSRAYMGMTIPDFPNLFMTIGPNTGTGHGGSMITVAELQVRYILEAVGRLVEQGALTVECTHDAYEEYNRRVDEAHAELVWTDTRMRNWYRNTAGRVVSVMPWRVVDYFTMTRQVDPHDFVWSKEAPAKQAVWTNARARRGGTSQVV